MSLIKTPIITNEDWGQCIDDLIDMIYDHEPWAPLPLLAKLGEECGELSEHVLVNEQLIKKDLKERIEGETADVINCALGVAISSMRLMGIQKEYVKFRLYEGMITKTTKYRTGLGLEQ